MRPRPIGGVGPSVKVLQALEGCCVGGTWDVLQPTATSPPMLSCHSHEYRNGDLVVTVCAGRWDIQGCQRRCSTV